MTRLKTSGYKEHIELKTIFSETFTIFQRLYFLQKTGHALIKDNK